MGDVSVLVLSGVWQSRRLTSPLRGRGEPKLFIVPTDAGVANMTKRALGAELLVSAIQLLPFSSTLLPAQNFEYNEELNEDDFQSDKKDQDAMETDAMIKKKANLQSF